MAFPYLGLTFTFNKSDWETLYKNLWKSRRWCRMVANVFTQTVSKVTVWAWERAREMVYNAVVQVSLLYGSKIWVVMGAMLKVLEDFHHRVARQIAGKMDRRTVDRDWEWPAVEDALEISGICTIKEYIQRRKATIAVHIAYRSIYDMFTGAEKMSKYSQFMRWWDQDVGREVE